MAAPAGSSVDQYKLSTRIGLPNKHRSLKSMQKSAALQNHPYFGLARISVKPQRKLCDLTGLPAPYTCPRTLLRYYNASVYKHLESLSPEHSEKYHEAKMYGKGVAGMRK